jgi:hypothetical protein
MCKAAKVGADVSFPYLAFSSIITNEALGAAFLHSYLLPLLDSKAGMKDGVI